MTGDGKPSPYTQRFCEYKPERLYKHPNSPKWFISCGGGEGVSGICQRCGPHAELELNEDCQMCLYPGESESLFLVNFYKDFFSYKVRSLLYEIFFTNTKTTYLVI